MLFNESLEIIELLNGKILPMKNIQSSGDVCILEESISSAGPLVTGQRVSVIVPFFNRNKEIGRALASIKAQTYKNIEVITIDDGSTDGGSQVVLENCPEAVLIRLPKNKGVSAARNEGIKAAKGDFIAFLDSDDQWNSNYLEEQVAALMGNPRFNLSFSAMEYVNEKNERERILEYSPSKVNMKPICRLLVELSFIPSMSCVAVRKSVFKKVDLLNERLRGAEDRDFYIRLLKTGNNFVYIAKPLAVKHNSSEQLSGSWTRILHSAILMLQLFMADKENAVFRSFALKGLCLRIRELLGREDVPLWTRTAWFFKFMQYAIQYIGAVVMSLFGGGRI